MTNALFHYTQSSEASLIESLLRLWGRSGAQNGRRKGGRTVKLSVTETIGSHWLLPASNCSWNTVVSWLNSIKENTMFHYHFLPFIVSPLISLFSIHLQLHCFFFCFTVFRFADRLTEYVAEYVFKLYFFFWQNNFNFCKLLFWTL